MIFIVIIYEIYIHKKYDKISINLKSDTDLD